MNTTMASNPIDRPSFAVQSFQDPTSFFFYNTVNAQDWTLKVQVLGPNLSFTFHHRPLPGGLSSVALEKKTVGFLVITSRAALSHPSSPLSPSSSSPLDPLRIAKWAQSGHGMGSRGDTLLPNDHCLSNRKWTRRTMRLQKVLGVDAAHPFDQGRNANFDQARRGAYRAAHVEVKLATHAVHALLRAFNIEYDPERITRATLAQLLPCRNLDRSAPVVEIYFSRKNCAPCGTFVTRLQAITGVQFRLIWRHRLERVLYANEMDPTNPRPAQDQVVIDDSDEDDDDIQILELIDIDSPSDDESPISIRGSPMPTIEQAIQPQITIQPQIAMQSQIAQTARMFELVDLTTEPLSDSRRPGSRQSRTEATNNWLDGISYALGQSHCCPDMARAAVVDLARAVRRQRQYRQATTPRRIGPERAQYPQPQSAPSRLQHRTSRSITPGRTQEVRRLSVPPAARRPQGRSRSPVEVIDLEMSPSERHVRRRRQRH
ncbi:hypothetical protein CC79DRAFT_646904 [Sarocladium strictum]